MFRIYWIQLLWLYLCLCYWWETKKKKKDRQKQQNKLIHAINVFFFHFKPIPHFHLVFTQPLINGPCKIHFAIESKAFKSTNQQIEKLEILGKFRIVNRQNEQKFFNCKKRPIHWHNRSCHYQQILKYCLSSGVLTMRIAVWAKNLTLSYWIAPTLFSSHSVYWHTTLKYWMLIAHITNSVYNIGVAVQKSLTFQN